MTETKKNLECVSRVHVITLGVDTLLKIIGSIQILLKKLIHIEKHRIRDGVKIRFLLFLTILK